MGMLNWIASLAPSPAEVRAEVWRLGVRHHGYALDGAMKELAEAPVSPARAALLRACVQHLRRA
jgi:hypothetical protein